MATSEAGQQTAQYGVLDYEPGDLLVDVDTGRSTKLALSECPFCATDPRRPRYHFKRQESRPRHIREVHGRRQSDASV